MLSRQLNLTSHIEVSRQTISRRLCGSGLLTRVPAKKHLSQKIRKYTSLSPMNKLLGQTINGPRLTSATNLSTTKLVLMEHDLSDEELAKDCLLNV